MGRVLLVGGSRAYPGAVHLLVGGALRSGAGYVVAACPAEVAAGLTPVHPEAIVVPLEGSALSPQQVVPLEQELQRAQALAIGPGLGLEVPTQDFVLDLLSMWRRAHPNRPAVIDADALNALAGAARVGKVQWSSLGSEHLVLTPHPGEAARLLGGQDAAEIERDRPAAWRALVERTGCTVLLKGAPTLVGGPGAHAPWENPTGNPGLATAGTGDVLTGLIAGLLARGLASVEAAQTGAYLHGLAADLAVATGSVEALVASDLLPLLPAAWRQLTADSSSH